MHTSASCWQPAFDLCVFTFGFFVFILYSILVYLFDYFVHLLPPPLPILAPFPALSCDTG